MLSYVLPVFSYGLPVLKVEIFVFSDHMPVLFDGLFGFTPPAKLSGPIEN